MWVYIINVLRSSCTVPINLVRFLCKMNFPDTFSKIIKYQISRKSVLWKPSCSMLTDTHRRTDGQTLRQTDRQAERNSDRQTREANSRISQFCEFAQLNLHHFIGVPLHSCLVALRQSADTPFWTSRTKAP